MKILFLLTLLFSYDIAFACWKLQGKINLKDEVIAIDQKILHGKTYSFQKGSYLFNLVMPTQAKNSDLHTLTIEVLEKHQATLKRLATGSMQVKENQPATMTAQHSDLKSTISIEVKLTHI